MSDERFVSTQVDEAFVGRVDVAGLEQVARRVLESEGVPSPAEVGLVITDDEAVRGLNRRFRGLDEATDVLSFGFSDEGEPFILPPNSAHPLGEVIVSFPAAERQAQEGGISLEDELARLVVHGLLHLLGYDDEEPEEERVMRAREESLLGGAEH
jgi:probable rRNA maturation factor